jgi:hypothetical protein
MSRSSRGRHSEPPPDVYYDNEVRTVWEVILRKMAGRVHIEAADGLLFTEPVKVSKIRFICAANKMINWYQRLDLDERPGDEYYHLVALPTHKAEDGNQGAVIAMSSESLVHFREQWLQVCLLALAIGWVAALDIIDPIFASPGNSWNETVTREEPERPEDEPTPEPRPKPKVTIVNGYKRDPAKAAEAKRLANGICQLCGKPAPFTTKKDEPYLESHHIIPLSKGGEDTVKNIAALCPNCHRRIHILQDPEDTNDLL